MLIETEQAVVSKQVILKNLDDSLKGSLFVDRNPEMGYECRRLAYVLAWPLMILMSFWAIVKTLMFSLFGLKVKYTSIFFDRFSKTCSKIRAGAATFRALDIIYNFRPGSENRITDYWVDMVNAQAVRNRKRMVRRELTRAMIRLIQRGEKEIKLFSVASGSAQAVLEAMDEVRNRYGEVEVKAILFDRDKEALTYSRQLAMDFGLEEAVTTVYGTASRKSDDLEKALKEHCPQIVEVIGFLDYLDDEAASSLIARIYSFLEKNGVGFLFTANINFNFEMMFLRWVISWKMTYRSSNRLRKVVLNTQVPEGKFKIMYEPHEIHGLVIIEVV